ncbi:MAG TPA: hypothetical protein PLV72_01825 [Candidatus Magasanikbacteria bacterium]|nr:hypothetical protein [Candidatus Magasanikbacteria bacterium]
MEHEIISAPTEEIRPKSDENLIETEIYRDKKSEQNPEYTYSKEDPQKQIETVREKIANTKNESMDSKNTLPKSRKTEILVDIDLARQFLISQGLTEEQARSLKIEYKNLIWSNKVTRAIAKFLPGRLGEFFTRIESSKGDTLKIFTNNLEVLHGTEDTEKIIRDTTHHLMHFVQRKKGTSWIKHLITRLPIVHGLSQYEREARKIAEKADLSSEQWSGLVKFSNTL